MKALFAHDHRFVSDGEAFYDFGGLPEAALRRYADVFDRVDVICRSTLAGSGDLHAIGDPRIKFLPQPDLRSISGLSNFGSVRKSVIQQVASADVVVARLPSLLGWMAARAARKLHVPYVIEVVGNAKEASQLHGSRLGALTGPIEHWLTRREVQKAHNVIYITECYLQRVYPTTGRFVVCPNVMVTPISEAKLAVRLQRFPQRKFRRIGLIGSLDVNYKGHAAALRALKILRARPGFSDVSLEFAGRGDKRRWVALAKELGVVDAVTFLGTIPPGEGVMDWLDDIDLLLQPSKTEAQGRSILEGMSRGCPVVASNVGGIPELLSPEVLTAPDDASAISVRCAQVLGDTSFYRLQATRNLRETHRFDVDVIERVRYSFFAELRAEAENRQRLLKSEGSAL